MSLLRKRSWWQRLTSSRLTLAVVLLAAAVCAFAVYDRYAALEEAAERRAEKEAEFRALEVRKEALEQKVEYLEGDQGREAEIRGHFDVARAGEKVVVLTGEKKPEQTDAAATPEAETWRQRWFSWWPF